MVADTPTAGRGVKALARRDDDVVSVISWHAPNAAGEGVETKMAGYRAVVTAIGATAGPLVVGLDSNHWSLSTDLDLVDNDANSRFAVENQFFSGGPQHRLRDALNVYLREHRDAYEKLISLRPNGPLRLRTSGAARSTGSTTSWFPTIFALTRSPTTSLVLAKLEAITGLSRPSSAGWRHAEPQVPQARRAAPPRPAIATAGALLNHGAQTTSKVLQLGGCWEHRADPRINHQTSLTRARGLGIAQARRRCGRPYEQFGARIGFFARTVHSPRTSSERRRRWTCSSTASDHERSHG